MHTQEMARLVHGTLDGDPEREIVRITALDSAGPSDLSFAEGDRALAQAASSQAGCILIPEGAEVPGHTTITVKHVRLALARLAEALHPRAAPPPGIHPSAVVAPDVALGDAVSVGPQAVIEAGVTIGASTQIGAGSVIGRGVAIGRSCIVYPRVTIYPGARLGDRVIVHSGAVLGGDGFGYIFAEGRYQKFPQLGDLLIEDDVEIGCNTTIDRGSLGTTVIGQGTKIDNLCQIAHNVRIGRHCVIAALTGIAGSTDVGDYVVMAGGVGISDHARIEDLVVLAGNAVVGAGKVIRKGTTVWGIPARPIAEVKKQMAHLARLPELAEKVKQLSKRLREE
jgi:UDP-3-O-[3-hydroxymyristoyl] glucosamine N-acyltransferase